MTRRCAVTGRTVQTGNNVSHAHNKTRRRFLPNLQMMSVYSDTLGKMVRLRISMYGLRTVEHKGGLDTYLLGARDNVLSRDALKIKRRIKKIRDKAAA
jgi:large subunit ribosomal protein L28